MRHLDAFKSEEISLPPPVASKKHSRKRPRETSNSATDPANTALVVKEPPHVPPMSAPSQIQPIATSTGKGLCKWWPLCKLDAQICGGIEKDRCSEFGVNGKKQAPKDSELARAYRNATWSETAKRWHCPWGCGLAVECGGMKGDSCEKYGVNGTDKDNRPSDEQVASMKKQRKAELKAQLRLRKRKDDMQE